MDVVYMQEKRVISQRYIEIYTKNSWNLEYSNRQPSLNRTQNKNSPFLFIQRWRILYKNLFKYIKIYILIYIYINNK